MAKTLIVERHAWETGGGQQQLQFVLRVAKAFFPNHRRTTYINVNVFPPNKLGFKPFTKKISISKEYPNGTRRTNGFSEIGSLLHNTSAFIFFEETGTKGNYNVWWQLDKAIVAAKYKNWHQGVNNQNGRGRLSTIVSTKVPNPIVRI
ncbi:MAG: hypothetical protein KDC73_12945 [Ignavibacteriae bacterium]|nr:hypothetical protein [Ignavibacteriota bacterium]MCB9242829.1 hypothetical protein [Ignavibacteriales bacterium]